MSAFIESFHIIPLNDLKKRYPVISEGIKKFSKEKKIVEFFTTEKELIDLFEKKDVDNYKTTFLKFKRMSKDLSSKYGELGDAFKDIINEYGWHYGRLIEYLKMKSWNLDDKE